MYRLGVSWNDLALNFAFMRTPAHGVLSLWKQRAGLFSLCGRRSANFKLTDIHLCIYLRGQSRECGETNKTASNVVRKAEEPHSKLRGSDISPSNFSTFLAISIPAQKNFPGALSRFRAAARLTIRVRYYWRNGDTRIAPDYSYVEQRDAVT